METLPFSETLARVCQLHGVKTKNNKIVVYAQIQMVFKYAQIYTLFYTTSVTDCIWHSLHLQNLHFTVEI
jgi:hypothetical protein